MPRGMFYRGRNDPQRPATADCVYSDEELEWLKAIDRWRRENNDRTPDCGEVLNIARSLGYAKLAPAGVAVGSPNAATDGPAGAFTVSRH